MAERTSKEYLKCILTEPEKKEIADKMALCVAQINDQEGNLKSVSTQIKSEIAKYQAELTQSAEKIRSGYEMRQVTCRIETTNKKMILTRLDTGEIVRERLLTPEELQQKLPEMD
jgi:hypothetical protein